MPTNAGDKAVECKPEQACEFVVPGGGWSRFSRRHILPVNEGPPMIKQRVSSIEAKSNQPWHASAPTDIPTANPFSHNGQT